MKDKKIKYVEEPNYTFVQLGLKQYNKIKQVRENVTFVKIKSLFMEFVFMKPQFDFVYTISKSEQLVLLEGKISNGNSFQDYGIEFDVFLQQGNQ